MEQPTVTEGDCIEVGTGYKRACVLKILKNGNVIAGYFQYEGRGKNKPSKPLKEEVLWDGERWSFKASGPDASYVKNASEESKIRRCYG